MPKRAPRSGAEFLAKERRAAAIFFEIGCLNSDFPIINYTFGEEQKGKPNHPLPPPDLCVCGTVCVDKGQRYLAFVFEILSLSLSYETVK